MSRGLGDVYKRQVQKGNEDFVAYLNEKIAEMQEQGLIDQYVAEAQTLAGIE